MILEAYANLALRVGRDCQPCFAVDALLVQVHVLLRTRVDDFNVDALALTRADVRSDDNKRIHVSSVPNAFCWRVAVGLKDKFDGACRMCKEQDCK